jgi:hypothetical protein
MHMMSRQIINYREQYVYNDILKDIFVWQRYWKRFSMIWVFRSCQYKYFFDETMPTWILMTIGQS